MNSNGASDRERLDAIVARLAPDEAKKWARVLWRMNDWLVDTGLGYVMDETALQEFGGLAVKLQRRANADA